MDPFGGTKYVKNNYVGISNQYKKIQFLLHNNIEELADKTVYILGRHGLIINKKSQLVVEDCHYFKTLSTVE